MIYLILFLLLIAADAGAATYYVDPACANNITIYNPKAAAGSRCTGGTDRSDQTIRLALARVSSSGGDSVLVRAGTYNELLHPALHTWIAGTSGARHTLAAYPGNCVTVGVKGPGGGCENVTLTSPQTVDAVVNTPDYWVIDGFHINATNAGYGIIPKHFDILKNNDICCSAINYPKQQRDGMGILMNRDYGGNPGGDGNNQVINNWIHNLSLVGSPTEAGLGSHGCYCESDNNTIEGNEFGPGIAQFGIQLYPAGSNNIVRYNIFHNTGRGLDTYFGGGSVGGGGITIYGSNNQVYSNLFYDNPGDISWQPAGKHQIYNNTLYGSSTSGFRGQGGGHTIRNNIVSSNGQIFYDEGPAGGGMFNGNTFSNNLCNGSSLPPVQSGCQFRELASATFVTPGSDFHLKGTSLAINNGFVLLPPYNLDITEAPRGTQFDIGAYEFGVGGGVPPVVNIISPTSTVSATVPITLSGTATFSGTTPGVTWSCDVCTVGGNSKGTAAGTSTWSIGPITLNPGANTITVTAQDSGGTTTAVRIQTYAVAPVLVAAISFDENTGATAKDISGNNNHVSLTGGFTWVPGKFGTAVSFDGTGQGTIANSSSLNLPTFTVELYARPAAAATTFRALAVKNYVIYLYGSIDAGAYCSTGGGATLAGMALSSGDETVCDTSALPITPNWTHVAITYDGSVFNLFKDGVLRTQTPASGAVLSSTDPLTIGGSQYGEFFSGAIDDLRVYLGGLPQSAGANDCISAPSILRDMNCPINPLGPPTVASGLTISSTGGMTVGTGGSWTIGN